MVETGQRNELRRGKPLPFKAIRLAQGRTQAWVAGQLGITKSRLCELENNYYRARIKVEELRKLAEIYGTTIDALLNEGKGHAKK